MSAASANGNPNDGLGLSRLLGARRVQQDRAAEVVRLARERSQRQGERIARVAEAMSRTGGESLEPHAAMAALAARAAGVQLLAELSAVRRTLHDEEEAAVEAHTAARREVRSLEKLQARLAVRERERELRAEQQVLDEVALRRRPREDADAEGGADR